MSDSDNEWDPEESIRQHFDPTDVTAWLKHPPEEFLGIMVHELRRETTTIEEYAKLLNAVPEIRAMTFTVNEHKMDADFCLDTVLKAARILHRLLDTARVYRDEISQQGS